MTKKLLGILAGALLCAPMWGDGNATETRLRTMLSGGAIAGEMPSGNADFRADSRNRSRLNVEVQHVRETDGSVLVVSVVHAGGSVNVGQIRITAGQGEMELNSQDGALAPAIAKGDMVVVSDAGGAILAGVF